VAYWQGAAAAAALAAAAAAFSMITGRGLKLRLQRRWKERGRILKNIRNQYK
jgi:hypothetical protein